MLVDGEGTLVTTETCLLNANRNPGLSRAEVDTELKRVLGVSTVIWLPGDPLETETDGHIDGLMAFAAPARALFEVNDDTSDSRFEILRENRRALELARDARRYRTCFPRLALIAPRTEAARARSPRRRASPAPPAGAGGGRR